VQINYEYRKCEVNEKFLFWGVPYNSNIFILFFIVANIGDPLINRKFAGAEAGSESKTEMEPN